MYVIIDYVLSSTNKSASTGVDFHLCPHYTGLGSQFYFHTNLMMDLDHSCPFPSIVSSTFLSAPTKIQQNVDLLKCI